MKSSKKYIIFSEMVSTWLLSVLPTSVTSTWWIVSFLSPLLFAVDGFFSEFSVSISPFNCSHRAQFSLVMPFANEVEIQWENERYEEDFATQLLLLQWWSKAAKKGGKRQSTKHLEGLHLTPLPFMTFWTKNEFHQNRDKNIPDAPFTLINEFGWTWQKF